MAGHTGRRPPPPRLRPALLPTTLSACDSPTLRATPPSPSDPRRCHRPFAGAARGSGPSSYGPWGAFENCRDHGDPTRRRTRRRVGRCRAVETPARLRGFGRGPDRHQGVVGRSGHHFFSRGSPAPSSLGRAGGDPSSSWREASVRSSPKPWGMKTRRSRRSSFADSAISGKFLNKTV